MKTWTDHLLLKLIEECAEVSQRAAKQMQYGKNEIEPGQALTNANRLVNELIDLEAAVQMLQWADELPYPPKEFIEHGVEKKAEKVLKYAELSRTLGMLEAVRAEQPCPRCRGEGRVDLRSITGDHNDIGIITTCPACHGAKTQPVST